jgi:ferritin-like metal-binding protein YciE
MAKEPKKLDDLFPDTLKDIYFAEKKILSTLPKMAKAAQSKQLRAAFEKHHGETEGQIERLEEVFALIEKKPQGKTCAAIVGITEEGAEIMTEYKGAPALDAGLLAAAQAVEHYEISRYGTLRTWAEELGLDEAVTLLQETLDEEEATDEALTEIAKTVVNQEAERDYADGDEPPVLGRQRMRLLSLSKQRTPDALGAVRGSRSTARERRALATERVRP